jgi:sulfite reductase beta subunit-like hemoprotein
LYRYGEDGCADITTRQNFQLRGIELKNSPEIIKSCMDLGMCSLQSGLDNVRNATGNPLAGRVGYHAFHHHVIFSQPKHGSTDDSRYDGPCNQSSDTPRE